MVLIDSLKVRLSESEAETICECEQRTAIEDKCDHLRGELHAETEHATASVGKCLRLRSNGAMKDELYMHVIDSGTKRV